MSEFTKLTGPYEASELSGRVAIATAHSGRRMVLFPLDGHLQSCTDKGVLEPIKGNEPHILKMVAAPELYEAVLGLMAVVADYCHIPESWPAYKDGQAALNKATNRE